MRKIVDLFVHSALFLRINCVILTILFSFSAFGAYTIDGHVAKDVDNYEDLIDEVFHRQLIECCLLEKKYFREHDEYSILKDRFRHLSHEYSTSFGVHTGYCSNGEVYVYDDENSEHREITIEELKRLIPLYDRLEMFIQELSEEVKDIKY